MKKTVISKSYSTSSYILPTPVASKPVTTTKQVDTDEQAYHSWKAQQGFSKPLSNQEYFNIYGTWR